MNIDRVTLTGADDKIDASGLKELSRLYPFVEWGILFSVAKFSSPRYPGFNKIIEFTKADVPLSAHFCGKYSRDVLENANFFMIESLHPNFKRVQLNYNFGNSNNWDLKPVIAYAENHPKISIILQYNKSNAFWLSPLLENKNLPNNIHFLYDSSGGRGTVIQNIPIPFGNYTGYSGGISELNILTVLKKVKDVSVNKSVWVDMETGVRIQNDFSLSKCLEVLENCNREFFN